MNDYRALIMVNRFLPVIVTLGILLAAMIVLSAYVSSDGLLFIADTVPADVMTVQTNAITLWNKIQGTEVRPQGVYGYDLFQRNAITVAPVLTTTISQTTYLPLIHGNMPAPVVIAAAHIDSSISGEADEALLLWNRGDTRQPLAGWQIATTSRRATFPLTSTLVLEAGAQLWCTAEATAFRLSFGLEPHCEWAADSDQAIVNLEGALTLANQGGIIQLYATNGTVVDTLIYGEENRPASGWYGVAAQLYARGDIPRSGQLWQRKRDPQTGLPIDTDRATDWQGDLGDLAWGRQVTMPGWQQLTVEPVVVANGTVTVAVGPEGIYQPLASFIAATEQTLDLSLYTFEHKELAELVADAARRGVRVRLLLEGSPAGGISDLQKWSVATIVAAGGDVQYLAVADSAPRGYRTRYRYLHAKYGISDSKRIFNGTENFTDDAIPLPQATPVGGRRGVYLFTDAGHVVQRLEQIFGYDWDPNRFADHIPFTPADATYGMPPIDFAFPERPHYEPNAAPFAAPVVAHGSATMAVISAPENATVPDQGIHALIAHAGVGDTITVLQLYEHKQWGDTTSNPIADPNPRLAMIIAAAERGARVQLLLDSYFDDPDALRSNQQTAIYLNQLAAEKGLLLEARLGNPTLGGIHAKVILMQIAGRNWSAVGSLNGSEVSHKLNREVVLLMDIEGIYQQLAAMFRWDWEQSSKPIPLTDPTRHGDTTNF